MPVDQEYLDFILDQLGEFGAVDTKNMFGGVGIFREGTMFAMIGAGKFRLRADEETRGRFEDLGMEQFGSERKKGRMPYWEVPAEVIEDRDELALWATTAYDVACRSKK